MHDDELDRFKRDINLVEFASDRFGYQRDPRESSRSSHVLRQSDSDDKILVAREPDGHWVYCSVRDGTDNGTVIDLVQRRRRLDLGRTRQELRTWLHTPRPDPGPARRPASPPVTRDRHAVALAYAAATSPSNSEYLNGRGIHPETLRSAPFAGLWRVDRRGNLLFPHTEEEGLCGFEMKGHGYTGFAAGGRKALWQSAPREGQSSLVVCESAIDALSYYQLHRLDHARYFSTAGQPHLEQLQQFSRLCATVPPRTVVVAAVDTDPAGSDLAAQLLAVASAYQLPFARHSPEPALGKDWNDVLQRVERDFIRSLGVDRSAVEKTR